LNKIVPYFNLTVRYILSLINSAFESYKTIDNPLTAFLWYLGLIKHARIRFRQNIVLEVNRNEKEIKSVLHALRKILFYADTITFTGDRLLCKIGNYNISFSVNDYNSIRRAGLLAEAINKFNKFLMSHDGKYLINKHCYMFSFKGRNIYFTFDRRDCAPMLGLNEIFHEEIYGSLNVKDKIVLDIGAGYDDSSIYFAVKGCSRSLALEPNPYLHPYITRNIELNNCEIKYY